MEILFYDVATPVAYTHQTFLQGNGVGGTESAIVRIAHELNKNHTVFIAQHCRQPADDVMQDGVLYCSLETANHLSPDAVILLRAREWLERVGQQFPAARHYFWLHNIPSKALYGVGDILQKYRYTVIAVSKFHQQVIQKRLAGKWYHKVRYWGKRTHPIPVEVLYAPLDDALRPDDTPWKPNQLFLASAPRKGLAINLKRFADLRRYFPDYYLLISTYSQWDNSIVLPENAKFLGSLSHPDVIQKMRESFCVFYPQYQHCETFGLVYAESNAVGTPVLAHDFGAAREVLSSPEQLVNGRHPASVIEKIRQWREQRPLLGPKFDFKLSRIGQDWENMLSKNEGVC